MPSEGLRVQKIPADSAHQMKLLTNSHTIVIRRLIYSNIKATSNAFQNSFKRIFLWLMTTWTRTVIRKLSQSFPPAKCAACSANIKLQSTKQSITYSSSKLTERPKSISKKHSTTSWVPWWRYSWLASKEKPRFFKNFSFCSLLALLKYASNN